MQEADGVGAEMPTYRVVVADDHPVYRGGLLAMLAQSPSFKVVADVGDGTEALEQIRRLGPDIAVVDLRLPGLDGIAVTRSVVREGIATRVVIVSAYESTETTLDAFDAGAWAYLSKVVPPEEIVGTLERVSSGERLLPEDLTRGLAERSARRGGVPGAALSAREHEVLELTAQGMSAPQIAEHLFLGTATVKTHLQRIYDKLNVSDRAAAVAQAHRRGLLD